MAALRGDGSDMGIDIGIDGQHLDPAFRHFLSLMRFIHMVEALVVRGQLKYSGTPIRRVCDKDSKPQEFKEFLGMNRSGTCLQKAKLIRELLLAIRKRNGLGPLALRDAA